MLLFTKSSPRLFPSQAKQYPEQTKRLVSTIPTFKSATSKSSNFASALLPILSSSQYCPFPSSCPTPSLVWRKSNSSTTSSRCIRHCTRSLSCIVEASIRAWVLSQWHSGWRRPRSGIGHIGWCGMRRRGKRRRILIILGNLEWRRWTRSHGLIGIG